jgi:hypothetical protein
MYKCVKSSITGNNLLTTEDGPTLFKKLTAFTMVASLQLSMLSLKIILEIDPAVHKFHIPTINTKLNHLFVLATTREHTLQPSEHILHTSTAYSRIKEPEQWAPWIHNQVDDFEAATLTVCQDFMNSAVIKYNNISGSNDGVLVVLPLLFKRTLLPWLLLSNAQGTHPSCR